MKASRGEKILVTVVFIVFAVPPGLCSMFGLPGAAIALFDRNANSLDLALIYGVPSLIGLAFSGGMLWWLMRTYRRT